VPNGWLYPTLAAFRANVTWDVRQDKFEWKVPLKRLVPRVIDDLGVCVTEHRNNNLQPDKVGKRESTLYSATTNCNCTFWNPEWTE
jgi:hypothetical protein